MQPTLTHFEDGDSQLSIDLAEVRAVHIPEPGGTCPRIMFRTHPDLHVSRKIARALFHHLCGTVKPAAAGDESCVRPLEVISGGDKIFERNVRTGEQYSEFRGRAVPLLDDLETLRKCRQRLADRLARFFIHIGDRKTAAKVLTADDPLLACQTHVGLIASGRMIPLKHGEELIYHHPSPPADPPRGAGESESAAS
jgi:hypothetical protein